MQPVPTSYKYNKVNFAAPVNNLIDSDQEDIEQNYNLPIAEQSEESYSLGV